MAALCGQSGQVSVSNLLQLLVKPAATSGPTCSNSATSRTLWLHPAVFATQSVASLVLTSDLSERPGLVVSPPSTRVCSRDEQLVSRFIHSNQHQQSSFNSRLVLQGLSERMAKVKRFL